jgi:catechol 2,3-dioxygenase-like lactoylglutathione lyase family enzyme
VIAGIHAVVYADDAKQARAFLENVLDLPNVDAHGGFLIFKLPPAELAVRSATHVPISTDEGEPGTHQLYLLCDDVSATVAELSSRGVEFSGPIEDRGFGLVVGMKVPGAGTIGLYQPHHLTAYDLAP